MLKKSITFTDYNGVQRTEDFYFELREDELTRLNFTTEGGLEAVLNQIIATQDMPQLYTYFEKIVQMSYGVKSMDGRYFDKSPEILHKFERCPAYNELIMELITSSDAAATFVNAVIPKARKVDQKPAMTVLPGQAPIAGVITPNS